VETGVVVASRYKRSKFGVTHAYTDGQVKDLRTLADFVVGKDIGSFIQELSELKEICGKFDIR